MGFSEYASGRDRCSQMAYSRRSRYHLVWDDDRTLATTTFRFNKRAFNGPVKQIHSTGYVRTCIGGAMWGVQVF